MTSWTGEGAKLVALVRAGKTEGGGGRSAVWFLCNPWNRAENLPVSLAGKTAQVHW